jgi:hypothetical protein
MYICTVEEISVPLFDPPANQRKRACTSPFVSPLRRASASPFTKLMQASAAESTVGREWTERTKSTPACRTPHPAHRRGKEGRGGYTPTQGGSWYLTHDRRRNTSTSSTALRLRKTRKIKTTWQVSHLSYLAVPLMHPRSRSRPRPLCPLSTCPYHEIHPWRKSCLDVRRMGCLLINWVMMMVSSPTWTGRWKTYPCLVPLQRGTRTRTSIQMKTPPIAVKVPSPYRDHLRSTFLVIRVLRLFKVLLLSNAFVA